MKPITMDEILRLDQYQRLRDRLRPLVIAEKDRRRLALGSHITFLFENAQTVWYQIEEMVRTERMTDPKAIQHEIDTYNELLPRPGELSATMMIEYGEAAERDAALRRLVGIERHLWIKVNGEKRNASFDDRQMSTERVSSVQFVRFPVGHVDPAEFLKLASDGQIAIEVDHPSLAARGVIMGPLASALASDFARD